MAGKIFYRIKPHEKDEATELVVVAVSDVSLTIYQKHLTLPELKHVAEAVGAELVELPRASRHERGRYHGEEDVDASAAI